MVVFLVCVMVVSAGCTGLGANESEEEFNMDPDESDDPTEIEDGSQDEADEANNSDNSSGTEDVSNETEGSSTSNEAATTSSEGSADADSKTVDTTRTNEEENSVEKNRNTGDNGSNGGLYMAEEVYILTVYVDESTDIDETTITLQQDSDNTTTTQEISENGLVEFDVVDGDYTISSTDQNSNSSDVDITIDGSDREVTLE